MSDIFGEGSEESPAITSVDMGAKEAIAHLNELGDIAIAQVFINQEGRKTVIAEAFKLFPELAVVADVVIEKGTELIVNADTVDDEEEIDGGQMYGIVIDEVEGRPNFEVVGINGKVWKIQRGVEAVVPGSVLEVLNNAVAERIVQTHNPQGGVDSRRQKYSAVPFRVMRVINA
jgi:hypothetical protein